MGLVQSLNISVACAVSLYEALRQRTEAGFYENNPTLSETEKADMFDVYKQRHEGKATFKKVERSGFDL